jgi:hypothetical protein
MTAFNGIQRPIYTLTRCVLGAVHAPGLAQCFTQHEFNFRNKAALLTEIQRQTRKGAGISVRALKESWKEAPQAIEELEEEGEVLVMRTVKDGQLRVVFWNEIKPEEDTGGMPVEKGRSLTDALSSSCAGFFLIVQSSKICGAR